MDEPTIKECEEAGFSDVQSEFNHLGILSIFPQLCFMKGVWKDN